MPKARNRYERAAQILHWLKHEWPPGRPVEILWVAEIKDEDGEYHGQAYRDGRAIIIELSERRCRHWEMMGDTIFHEYTHAIQWGPASVECHSKRAHHPASHWAQEGEIKDRWAHDHGAEMASEFPTE